MADVKPIGPNTRDRIGGGIFSVIRRTGDGSRTCVGRDSNEG